MVVEVGETVRGDTCRNCWEPINLIRWGGGRETWHHDADGSRTCASSPEAEPVSECSCGGSGWHDDPGWEPAYHHGSRSEWDGLIPCGFCNHGAERVDVRH